MAGLIEGKVIRISDCGDLITDITAAQLEGVPRDESVEIACDGHVTQGIFKLDHSQPDATLIALIGQSENLEIGIIGLNISEMLGISVGEKVAVRW